MKAKIFTQTLSTINYISNRFNKAQMDFYSCAAAFLLSLKSCKKQIYIKKEKRTSNNCLDRQIKLERSWWLKTMEEQRMDAGKIVDQEEQRTKKDEGWTGGWYRWHICEGICRKESSKLFRQIAEHDVGEVTVVWITCTCMRTARQWWGRSDRWA